MRKPIRIVDPRSKIPLRVEFSTYYYTGMLAAQLIADVEQPTVCADDPDEEIYPGDLWDDLTVNLPGYALPWRQSFVKDHLKRFVNLLAEQGVLRVVDTVTYGNFNSRAYVVEFAEEYVPPFETLIEE